MPASRVVVVESSQSSLHVPVLSGMHAHSVFFLPYSFGSPAGRRSFRINHLLMQGPVGACTVWPARRRSHQRLYLVVAIVAKRPARNACPVPLGALHLFCHSVLFPLLHHCMRVPARSSLRSTVAMCAPSMRASSSMRASRSRSACAQIRPSPVPARRCRQTKASLRRP